MVILKAADLARGRLLEAIKAAAVTGDGWIFCWRDS